MVSNYTNMKKAIEYILIAILAISYMIGMFWLMFNNIELYYTAMSWSLKIFTGMMVLFVIYIIKETTKKDKYKSYNDLSDEEHTANQEKAEGSLLQDIKAGNWH